MARGLLNLLLLLSPDMDMAMDMVMDIILAMVDMDIILAMVRGLLSQALLLNLQLLLSLDIFMAVDMAMDMDMDMDMAMVMDTMVKQICCSFIEFSTNEVDQIDPVKRNTLLIQLKYILKNS